MHVESFDSWEEAMEADNQRQLDLLPLIEPWQKDLSWGDLFAVYEPSEDLWVFCRVTPEEEIWPAKELEDIKNLSEKAELVAERASERHSVMAAWERGFRPCQNFSAWEVQGELSDCHVLKALLKLTPEEFESMRAINWSVKGFIEGEYKLAPSVAEATHKVVRKLIARVLTPGAVKHA